MKKLLFILLCVPLIGFGQTKEETEVWLQEQLSKCIYYSGDFNPDWKSSNCKVIFEDGLIKIIKLGETNISVIIPIKDITNFNFLEYDLGDYDKKIWKGIMIYRIYIGTKDNDITVNSRYTVGDYSDFSYSSSSTVFKLNYDFMKKDNMVERMTKAFNHLLELYGNTIYKEDTF